MPIVGNIKNGNWKFVPITKYEAGPTGPTGTLEVSPPPAKQAKPKPRKGAERTTSDGNHH